MTVNNLSDYSVIVYDEDGKVIRESFGRPLSNLEMALCDALDARNAWVQTLYSFAPSLRLEFQTVLLDTMEKVHEYSEKMNRSFRLGDQVKIPVPQEFMVEERQPRTMGHG